MCSHENRFTCANEPPKNSYNAPSCDLDFGHDGNHRSRRGTVIFWWDEKGISAAETAWYAKYQNKFLTMKVHHPNALSLLDELAGLSGKK